MRPRRPNSLRRKNGFALLITITLLAFLVLLLVSLASLTRVETQVASNNQQLAQARQNALMALNIAVGQLQKFAGPDQRITARSDMDATLANTTTANGRWTGVYGKAVKTPSSSSRDLYNDIPSKIASDAADDADTKGNQTQLLNWLVSGNENTAFDPATAIDANGLIARSSAPTSFVFTPSDTLNLTATPTALSKDITVTGSSGAKPARLLVGPNSVTTPSDYVAAPLVDIDAAAGVVPGTSGSAAITVGRYAWWVGDEGIKARVNLPKASASQAPLAFVNSQRAAVELMDGVHPVGSTSAFNTSDLIGGDYNPALTNLNNVMTPAQLTLLNTTSTTLPQALRYRYHDVSGTSTSLIVDTYAGGLKRDLSAVLAPLSATGASSPLDTDLIFPHETNTGTLTNEFGLPTWGTLRSFVKQTASSAGLTPTLPKIALPTLNGATFGTNPVSIGQVIAPVMTYAAIGFQYGAPGGDVVGGEIKLGVFPVVVLWNPYTSDIQAANYEFGIRKTYSAMTELQRRNPGDPATWSSANVIERRDFGKAGSTNSAAPDGYFRFIVQAGKIPAGQSIVYTLQNSGAEYDTSTNAKMQANALKSTSYNPAGYVTLPSTLTIAANNVGAIYRVGVNGRSDTAYGTTVTYFASQICNFGGNVTGPGTFDTYLAPETIAPATPPSGAYPFTGSAAVGFKPQWYQSFSPFNSAPYNTTSPYGSVGSGYAVATGNNGLVQDEALISIITQPKFRIISRATFSGLNANNGSTRWIAGSNPRALLVTSVPTTNNNNGISHYTGQPPGSVGTWPQGLTVKAAPPDGGPPRTSSGTKLTDITSGPSTGGGVVDTTLFEFRPETQPLLAIGQLQHANLAWHNSNAAYAIGNSIGDNNLSGVPDKVMRLTGGGGMNDPCKKITAFYDMSWLLNRALWDRYFVSTIPHAATGRAVPIPADDEGTTIPLTLPNPRYVVSGSRTNPDLKIAGRAAANLFLTGGFNINSTSEQAWRAILGGMNQLAYDPAGGVGGGPTSDSVMSRFTQPTTNASLSATTAYAAFQGYRRLSSEQVATLAKTIVSEIRARGPFFSLGDFVNRRLGDAGSFPQANDKRLKGTLQAAIDAASASTLGANAVINPATAPFTTLVNEDYNVASTNAFRTGVSEGGSTLVKAPVSSTASFAPQFLTQADLLTAIGSGLSARSDTFTVRTYGETVNPATNEIEGRAWCEAVVQRMPDFVEPKSGSAGNAPYDATSALTANNKKFGRQFKIVSFRWLSSTDI